MKKYYLKTSWMTEWQQVSKEVFIEAEHQAGFYPKCGWDESVIDSKCATAGFSGANGVKGKIESVVEFV